MDMRQALAARQIRNGIAPDVQPQPGMGKWEAMIRALGQDATNIGNGISKGVNNLGSTMRLPHGTKPEAYDTVTGAAMNTMGLGYGPAVGKMAMGNLRPDPAQMNIFANAWNGKGADTGKTMSAMRMHEAGASPQEIWAKTQRMQDGHGNWVDEIDDSGAKFIENPNIPDGVEPTLKDYLDHPALYERYPELGETAAWKTNSPEMNPGEGAYHPPGVTEKGEVTFKPTQPYSKDYQYEADADNLKLLLHEAGHGVQEFGGMPRGGSPDMFMAKNSGNHTQTQLANRVKLIQALQDEGYTTNEIGSLMKSENSRGGFSTDTLEMKDGKEFGFNDLNMTQSQLDNQPSVPVGYMNEARDVQGMLDLKKSVSRDPNERYESYTDLWGEQASNAAMNRAGLDAAGRAERFPGLDFKTPQDAALYHYSGKDGWNELPEVSAKAIKPPKKTVKAYKLFRTDPKFPGELFPLFVDGKTPVKVGEWLAAKIGEGYSFQGKTGNHYVPAKTGDSISIAHWSKAQRKEALKLGVIKNLDQKAITAVARRPGWHAGDLPFSHHLGSVPAKGADGKTRPSVRPDNHVWAEVEMPADIDWQTKANSRASIVKSGKNKGNMNVKEAHITDELPAGGHYRYKTNANMAGEWMIGGEMKVNKILTDADVKRINDAAGVADLPRLAK